MKRFVCQFCGRKFRFDGSGHCPSRDRDTGIGSEDIETTGEELVPFSFESLYDVNPRPLIVLGIILILVELSAFFLSLFS